MKILESILNLLDTKYEYQVKKIPYEVEGRAYLRTKNKLSYKYQAQYKPTIFDDVKLWWVNLDVKFDEDSAKYEIAKHIHLTSGTKTMAVVKKDEVVKGDEGVSNTEATG